MIYDYLISKRLELENLEELCQISLQKIAEYYGLNLETEYDKTNALLKIQDYFLPKSAENKGGKKLIILKEVCSLSFYYTKTEVLRKYICMYSLTTAPFHVPLFVF